MARKTKEERRIEEMERRAQERQEKYLVNKDSWITRLMTVMEVADDVQIHKGLFCIYMTEPFQDNYGHDYNETHRYFFQPVLDVETVSEQLHKLEEIEYIVEKIMEQKREQERIEKIKSEALAKLTKEERKALGL